MKNSNIMYLQVKSTTHYLYPKVTHKVNTDVFSVIVLHDEIMEMKLTKCSKGYNFQSVFRKQQNKL